MRFFALHCLPLVVATALWAAEKPVVYNNTSDPDDPLDRAVRQAYSEQFAVEDTNVTAGFVPPRPTAGQLPRYARTPEGDTLEGYVLVAYIITAEGKAVEPRILKSTDERLNATATKALESWQFSPATYKGSSVPSTAAQEFRFTSPDTTGFATTNLVLFQKDPVLKARFGAPGRLAAAVEKIQQAVETQFAETKEPATLALFFVVQPGGQSKLWITGEGVSTETQIALRKRLDGLPSLDVKDGPVAFALCGSIAGAAAPELPPLPPDWEKAGANLKDANLTDETLAAIWSAP